MFRVSIPHSVPVWRRSVAHVNDTTRRQGAGEIAILPLCATKTRINLYLPQTTQQRPPRNPPQIDFGHREKHHNERHKNEQDVKDHEEARHEANRSHVGIDLDVGDHANVASLCPYPVQQMCSVPVDHWTHRPVLFFLHVVGRGCGLDGYNLLRGGKQDTSQSSMHRVAGHVGDIKLTCVMTTSIRASLGSLKLSWGLVTCAVQGETNVSRKKQPRRLQLHFFLASPTSSTREPRVGLTEMVVVGSSLLAGWVTSCPGGCVSAMV
ncbi:hypothetical protein B0T24DRAFT_234497 [Lasiosphaeria ovina]|uniref:Uncharacterized protein n=1 Tax=Lasiosphaeria ovina TaxID=92902 RepID=A0AAE0NBZ6_9PEZI|nr:hypothetical protein B0T24DRAFT_234497 [Lasiosphaeria ovina]